MPETIQARIIMIVSYLLIVGGFIIVSIAVIRSIRNERWRNQRIIAEARNGLIDQLPGQIKDEHGYVWKKVYCAHTVEWVGCDGGTVIGCIVLSDDGSVEGVERRRLWYKPVERAMARCGSGDVRLGDIMTEIRSEYLK